MFIMCFPQEIFKGKFSSEEYNERKVPLLPSLVLAVEVLLFSILSFSLVNSYTVCIDQPLSM